MAAVQGPLLVSRVSADLSVFSLSTQSKQEERFAPYCGTWVKDKEASESMADVCTCLGLNSLMHHAVKLLKGLEIGMSGGTVRMSVCSIISWFKLNERYPVDGSEAKNPRRDMRTGGMITRLTGGGDKVVLHMHWGGTYAGAGMDELTLPTPDILHIKTSVWMKDTPHKPASSLQIYRRVV